MAIAIRRLNSLVLSVIADLTTLPYQKKSSPHWQGVAAS